MALRKAEATAGAAADEVFNKLNQRVENSTEKERMKTVSFQIRPSDYEELRKIFEGLGLSVGSGLRFALTEFKRNHTKKA
jgi:hypothetical protein